MEFQTEAVIRRKDDEIWKIGRATEICQTARLNTPACIAVHLAEKFGLIAAVPDGEDSAGRSKARLMTPPEMVERAAETAKLLWLEFQKRDWILEVPLPTERHNG